MELDREIGGGARIRAGIEFDAAGRRVAYRVLSSRPGDPLGSLRMDPFRVPAADCLHLFKPLAAGQLRGITGSRRYCCGCTSSTSSRTPRW